MSDFVIAFIAIAFAICVPFALKVARSDDDPDARDFYKSDDKK